MYNNTFNFEAEYNVTHCLEKCSRVEVEFALFTKDHEIRFKVDLRNHYQVMPIGDGYIDGSHTYSPLVCLGQLGRDRRILCGYWSKQRWDLEWVKDIDFGSSDGWGLMMSITHGRRVKCASTDPNKCPKGLSTGAIVAIVVGVILALVLIAALVALCVFLGLRRRRRRRLR